MKHAAATLAAAAICAGLSTGAFAQLGVQLTAPPPAQTPGATVPGAPSGPAPGSAADELLAEHKSIEARLGEARRSLLEAIGALNQATSPQAFREAQEKSKGFREVLDAISEAIDAGGSLDETFQRVTEWAERNMERISKMPDLADSDRQDLLRQYQMAMENRDELKRIVEANRRHLDNIRSRIDRSERLLAEYMHVAQVNQALQRIRSSMQGVTDQLEQFDKSWRLFNRSVPQS
jgi:methyl-accepting chemotaxis protein